MNQHIGGLELTPPTVEIVGRQDEIRDLRDCLHDRGARHFRYYWARGGLGKTRLLQEVQRLVTEAGPGFYTSGIIDLYHTDLHSTSDIERAIVDGLAPLPGLGEPEPKYFYHYRRQRHKFALLRERGADPQILEEQRSELSQAFVNDCRDMAVDAKKIVLCFDTIELLQYETSIVEEIAELEEMDARVKPWLLQNLSQLGNVLVVFAGRPKEPLPGEQTNPQERLIADLRAAFGKDFLEQPLEALDETGTEEFIAVLDIDPEVREALQPLIPVVHLLTEGRPIMLHLIVDLLQGLAEQPREILDMFEECRGLVGVSEGDVRLQVARQDIEVRLLKGVFNAGGIVCFCLARIATMPKGVDVEILEQTLGLPKAEAQDLLDQLASLSFIKRYEPPAGAERVHGERTFLHDEMYRLLTKRDVIPNLPYNERQMARMLSDGYYADRIEELERELGESPPEERIPLRERMQKLQVEQLYYLLVWNPLRGYERYKQLSTRANVRRSVGFSMRLLDEFLRLWNVPERRQAFADAGLSYERVIRDSAQMWVERLHTWGQHTRTVDLGNQIRARFEDLCIRSDQDQDIVGNIYALWLQSLGVLSTYDEDAVIQALELLEQLPLPEECTPDQALARARLANAVGYHHQLGGMLARATREFSESLSAYRRTEGYREEYTRVLNNLAYAHAQQGQFRQARTLGHEALRTSEELGHDYDIGLTLSTLGGIAMLRGNYGQAMEYAEEALEAFRRVGDPHGLVMAYTTLAKAARWRGRNEYRKGRPSKMGEARRLLDAAKLYVERALDTLEQANLGAERYTPLHAELGRVHRGLGDWLKLKDDPQGSMSEYRLAQEWLTKALATDDLSIVERANTLHDLASVLVCARDHAGAREQLDELAQLFGKEYRITDGKQPSKALASEYFEPLGKAEWLRGRMAMAEGNLEEGAQHLMLAYAYIWRFSPSSILIDFMPDDIYTRHLRTMSESQIAAFLEHVSRIADEQDLGVELGPFVQVLRDMV